MFTHTIAVNASVVKGFNRLVQYHVVNSTLGGVCACINLCLLTVFLSYMPFRKKYQLLILLAVGDTINGFAIILTGLNRVHLYTTAYRTLTLPVRTPWECAIEPWLILKLIGDLLLPITTLCMGIERLVAIICPIFYHHKLDGRPMKILITCGTCISFVTLSMIVAFLIAAHKEHDHDQAMYYCGRKAAFGDGFGSFIYIHNILCNCLATAFNLCAYIKARGMIKAQSRMQRQLGLIKNYFIISVVSAILVSLPNCIALFQVYVKSMSNSERKRLSNSLSKPSYWAQTANSGIHFFVYLALNSEFRERVWKIMRCNTTKKSQDDEMLLKAKWSQNGSSRVSVQHGIAAPSPAHI